MKNFFFITGLPRSKTAWLANFLTYGNTICLHDAFTKCQTVSDLKTLMEACPAENVGHSCPGNLMFRKQLRMMFPNARWLIVDRDLDESMTSASWAFGIPIERVGNRLFKREEYEDFGCSYVRVRFEDVQEKAIEIAKLLAPGFSCPQERIDMLANFNVQLQRDYIAANLQKQMNNPILKEVA